MRDLYLVTCFCVSSQGSTMILHSIFVLPLFVIHRCQVHENIRYRVKVISEDLLKPFKRLAVVLHRVLGSTKVGNCVSQVH